MKSARKRQIGAYGRSGAAHGRRDEAERREPEQRALREEQARPLPVVEAVADVDDHRQRERDAEQRVTVRVVPLGPLERRDPAAEHGEEVEERRDRHRAAHGVERDGRGRHHRARRSAAWGAAGQRFSRCGKTVSDSRTGLRPFEAGRHAAKLRRGRAPTRPACRDPAAFSAPRGHGETRTQVSSSGDGHGGRSATRTATRRRSARRSRARTRGRRTRRCCCTSSTCASSTRS